MINTLNSLCSNILFEITQHITIIDPLNKKDMMFFEDLSHSPSASIAYSACKSKFMNANNLIKMYRWVYLFFLYAN